MSKTFILAALLGLCGSVVFAQAPAATAPVTPSVTDTGKVAHHKGAKKEVKHAKKAKKANKEGEKKAETAPVAPATTPAPTK